eukprot:36930-Eustigmatos_ZCMA.PRE.1
MRPYSPTSITTTKRKFELIVKVYKAGKMCIRQGTGSIGRHFPLRGAPMWQNWPVKPYQAATHIGCTVCQPT